MNGGLKMIKIVNGNILDATENIIGHQVNCQGVMGSGVAKAIREKFPVAYDEYIELFKIYEDHRSYLLGQCQIVFTDKVIANLFGQEKYGYDGKMYTNVEALQLALKQVAYRMRETGETLALPYLIGCARGGADWNVVLPMIEEVFHDLEVTLYRYEG
jgi:O-acetyl-ADP-ribose deacetylase (regulator of RNase III)